MNVSTTSQKSNSNNDVPVVYATVIPVQDRTTSKDEYTTAEAKIQASEREIYSPPVKDIPFSTTTEEDSLPTATAQPVSATTYHGDDSSYEINGADLLRRMKQHRKAATINNGLWGGLFGLIVLGPVGAVGIGYGSALITKHSLKRREKRIRKRLQGRLNEPIGVQYVC